MDYRRKFRAVIHREIIEPVCFFCLSIGVRIRAAHKPEDRRGMPFSPERSKVLAGRRGAGFPDPICSEISTERVNPPLAGLLVVYVERIVIQGRDLWFARGTGGRRLGIDDPLDRIQYSRPYAS